MEFITPLGRIASDLWVNVRLRTISSLVRCEGKKILDLGCESGYWGLHYVSNNDVYFADIVEENISRLPVDESRKFVVDATQSLPFREFFDYVICADVLEHVEEDELVLRNIWKALRRGGEAVITVPAYTSLYGHHDKLIGHHRRYDKNDLEQRMEGLGFKVVLSRYTCPLLFLPFWINQRFLKQNRAYQGRSKLEPKILPLLNLIATLDSKLNLPFGVGLLLIAEKT